MRILRGITIIAGAALIAACGGGADSAGKTETPAETETAASAGSAKEDAAWRDVSKATAPDVYAVFLEAYPDGKYAREAAARARIFEIADIAMSANVNAPEGQFMVSAPPVMQSDGTMAPSRAIQSIPEGTTLNLSFSTTIDGEKFEREIITTFDEMAGERAIFRNQAGDCFWHNAATGGVGYCEGAVPSPPDPDDILALMPYAWLVVANDL